MTRPVAPAAALRADLLIAPLLGGLATLGFPPFGFWPAPVIALAGLFFLASGRAWKRAALLGWLFGVAHFASGIYWVVISTHVYGGAPLWLSLLLATVLFAYMAVYPALLTGLASGAGLWRSPAGWLGVPALWLAGELLRGWVYSGFPWLSLGYVALDTPAERFAPLVGVHGLGLLYALSAYGLFRSWGARGAARPLAMLCALLPLTGALLPAASGWTREAGAPMRVAIVQGNVPQDEKWNPGTAESTLRRYREMTLAGAEQAQLVVWPEVVPNRPYDQVYPYFDELSLRLRERQATLLGGVLIRGQGEQIYNSMIAVGVSRGRYDKRHLVPFGEYFPIPDWLRPIMDVLGTPYSDFSVGPAQHTPIQVQDQRVGVSICFEDVFGGEFRLEARDAAFLVNATNDAWFARSSAPHQHLQIARFRSLETGRWLVRATNTGVSAFIAPDGRTTAMSGLFTTELLRGEVTPRAGYTPYARWGDAPLWWLSFVAVLASVAWSLRVRRFSGQ